MAETRRNVMVGLFVLTGIAAAGYLIVVFGKAPTSVAAGNSYPLSIRFPSAVGVRAGTLVTVCGKRIGQVRSLDFVDATRLDQGVRVVVAIDREYQLPVGSRALASEPGLGMGRPPIDIVPGPPGGAVLAAGAEIAGTTGTAVESLFPPRIVATLESTATQIGAAAEALKPVLDDLHLVLQQRSPELVDQPDGPMGNLSSATARIDAMVKHFNSVLGDPQVESNLKNTLENFYAMSADGRVAVGDLKTAAGDVKTAAGDIKALVGQGQGTLKNIDDNVNAVARSAISGMEKAGRLMDQLNDVATSVKSGEGTLGLLLNDGRLYESSVLTFRRLAEAVEEFKLLIVEWQKGRIRIAL